MNYVHEFYSRFLMHLITKCSKQEDYRKRVFNTYLNFVLFLNKFININNSAHIKKVSGTYDYLSKKMDDFDWYKDKILLSMIEKKIPKSSKTILDLCCGTGNLINFINSTRDNARILGVDVSAKMIEHAKNKFNDSTKNIMLINSNWVSSLQSSYKESFDVIIIKNALHLIDDKEQRIKELNSILKKNGRLIIVETISPNVDSNYFVKNLFSKLNMNNIKKTYFTKHTLLNLFNDTSWKIIKKQTDYVEQYIDVPEWLNTKCALNNRQDVELYLKNASLNVRRSMKFVPRDIGVIPKKMLRLQMVLTLNRNDI